MSGLKRTPIGIVMAVEEAQPKVTWGQVDSLMHGWEMHEYKKIIFFSHPVHIKLSWYAYFLLLYNIRFI